MIPADIGAELFLSVIGLVIDPSALGNRGALSLQSPQLRCWFRSRSGVQC